MIIINLLLVLVFGFLIVGYIIPKGDLIERISLSFVIGMGLFTFIWFIANLLGLKFSNFSIILTLLVPIIILRNNYWKINFDRKYFKNLSIVEKIFITMTAFLILSSFVGDVYWPVRHWDSLTLYDFRARLFTETGFVKKSIMDVSFFAYPLMTSLMHTFSYISLYKNPSFLYNLFYLSVVVNFFSSLKKLKINRLIVFLLTLMIAISPRIFDHSMTAYTNLPYLTYYFISTIYLYWGIKYQNYRYFILSGVLSGLSAWTRSTEPFYLSQILVVLFYSVYHRKWSSVFAFGLPLLIFVFTWKLFVLNFNWDISTIVTVPKDVNYFSDLKLSSIFYYNNFIIPYWSYLVLLLLIIANKVKNRLHNWYYVVMICLNLIMIYVGTFVFVLNYDEWRDISDSLTRMAMFIPAMVVFGIAQLLSDSKKGYNRSII